MRLKLCAKCQKVIQAPQRYCDECQKKVNERTEEYKKKANRKRYNDEENKKYIQFYNSKAWRILRKKYIDVHYLCEDCLKEGKKELAEEVHHIKGIKTPEGWTRRFDWYNLKALCHYHHDIVEGRFIRKR